MQPTFRPRWREEAELRPCGLRLGGCRWLSAAVLHKTRPHVCAGSSRRLVHKPPTCMHRYSAGEARHKSRQRRRCRYKKKWQGAGQEKRGRQRRHPTFLATSRSLSVCLGPTNRCRNTTPASRHSGTRSPKKSVQSCQPSGTAGRNKSTPPTSGLFAGTCILTLQQDAPRINSRYRLPHTSRMQEPRHVRRCKSPPTRDRRPSQS